MKPKHKNTTLLLVLLIAGINTLWSCKKDKDVSGEGSGNPVVESYYPNSGNAGTLVNIVGSGFGKDRSAFTATVGGTTAEIIQVTDEKIVLRSPKGGSSGAIVLQNGNQRLEVGDYTYQSLSVHSISPQRAQANAEIHIIGAGFESAEAQPEVTINGKEATITQVSATELVAIIPEGAGSGAVEVTIGGASSKGQDLTYMAITAVKPLSGGAGTRIRISGEGFADEIAGNTFVIQGLQGQVLEASETEVVVVAPADVESGDVVLQVEGANVTGPMFTVVPAPLLEVVTPLSGPSGIEMTISGDYFSAAEEETSVFINNTPVAFSSISGTEIKLTVPADIGSGKVKVVVNDQSTEGPQFKSQNLGITALSQSDGLAGSQVTITGVGFSTIATENTVLFNNTPAQVLSATETSLTVVAPDGLSTGKIQVGTGGLTAESAVEFRRAGMATAVNGNELGLQLTPTTSVMAADDEGNLYFGEQIKQTIYKVSISGAVTVFAGSGTGESGNTDGIGTQARLKLNGLMGMVFNPTTQKLYFADQGGLTLRSITLSGQVETVYTTSAAIHYTTVGSDGSVYIVQEKTPSIIVWNPVTNTSRTVYGPSSAYGNTQARFVGSDGLMYYPNGAYVRQYHTLNTNPPVANDRWLMVVNIAQMGRIDDNNMVLLHTNNRSISQVDIRTKSVKTLFNWTVGTGFVDGDSQTAKTHGNITDIDSNKDGSILYILDVNNNAIRKIYTR